LKSCKANQSGHRRIKHEEEYGEEKIQETRKTNEMKMKEEKTWIPDKICSTGRKRMRREN
jgi:hypothetical protein